MTGTRSFFQIPVADTARAKTFSGGLFGWQFAPGNLGGTADEPVRVPSGRFAACRDDQGTHFYLWEDAS